MICVFGVLPMAMKTKSADAEQSQQTFAPTTVERRTLNLFSILSSDGPHPILLANHQIGLLDMLISQNEINVLFLQDRF
jgi:hypothetical protein